MNHVNHLLADHFMFYLNLSCVIMILVRKLFKKSRSKTKMADPIEGNEEDAYFLFI